MPVNNLNFIISANVLVFAGIFSVRRETFFSGYSGGYNSQPYIYPQYQSQYSRYQEFVSKHKPKHRKRPHPKKFKFSEETDSLEDFDSSRFEGFSD